MASSSAEERSELGRRARDYYLANYSEQVIGDRLSELLLSAAEGAR